MRLTYIIESLTVIEFVLTAVVEGKRHLMALRLVLVALSNVICFVATNGRIELLNDLTI